MEITFKLILTLNPVGPGPPDPGLPDVPVLPFGNNIMRQTFRYKLHSYEYLYTSRVAGVGREKRQPLTIKDAASRPKRT